MKPSWDDAPPWAQYLSWDEAGDGGSPWKWHEEEPTRLHDLPTRWTSTKRHMIAYPAPRHKVGFERRPEES